MRIIFLILLFICTAYAGNATDKVYQLYFDKETVETNEVMENVISVTTNSSNAIFSDSPNAPFIPSYSNMVLLNGGVANPTYTIEAIDSVLIAENVSLAENLPAFPTNEIPSVPKFKKLRERDITIQCSLSNISKFKDYSILNFKVTPFIYNVNSRKLYLATRCNLNLSYSETENLESYLNLADVCDKSILNFIVNSNELMQTNSDIYEKEDEFTLNAVEYIVITADSLKDSFKPLAEWKTKKGIKSIIITTEHIDKNYSGSDLQEKIKRCLYSYYKNNGLKYVLLGGDDSIVPVRGCYGQVYKGMDSNGKFQYYIDNNIPTDLYYSCFDGDFNWDYNQKGIYGEHDDNINMNSNIATSRIPLRTNFDAKAFVSRQLNYEFPKKNSIWNENILMTGVKLFGFPTESSTATDGYLQTELLYSSSIEPYWSGGRDRFYDCFTDFQGCESFDVTGQNLFNLIADGYMFLEITAHGGSSLFQLENSYYQNSHASSQTNRGYSILSTNACYTNRFDVEPCLSECLIRNPNSGIIGYLGSSRYGWGAYEVALGPSMLYESYFYKSLFSSTQGDKRLGKLVNNAKYSMQGSSDIYNAYRWLQFSWNPIGDPEMPIYIHTPKKLSIPKYTTKENNLILTFPDGNCDVCIMSTKDSGRSVYHKYTDDSKIIITEEDASHQPLSICITKYGYVPLVLELQQINSNIKIIDSDSNRIIENSGIDVYSQTKSSNNMITNITTDTAVINVLTETDSYSSSVLILDIYGNKIDSKKINKAGQNTSIFDCPIPGVYIVGLEVNGTVASTRQIAIK